MNRRSPVIYGCHGTRLSSEERALFSKHQPLGLILFSRNIETPDQVRALTGEFRDLIDGPVLVAIDQEGGRVARLKPPHWRDAPPMAVFGDMAQRDSGLAASALRLNCRLIALELRRLGINTDCLPVLDIPVSGSDEIIGDRAFASDPQLVSALGRIAVESLMEAGVLPVIKHMPGHGRALVDSHTDLPVVSASLDDLANSDLLPFEALSDAPLGMSAHIVYDRIDPDRPATLSKVVIGRVIRMKIGFRGLLLTDDLSMGALSGSLEERASAALAAGCDILTHCNGDMTEMLEIASVAGSVPEATLETLEKLLVDLDRAREFDYDDTLEAWNNRYDEWMNGQGGEAPDE